MIGTSVGLIPEAGRASARTVSPQGGRRFYGDGSMADWKSGSDTDDSESGWLGVFEERCPTLNFVIDFWLGNCTRLRCAASCWTLLIGALVWLFFTLLNLVYGNQGSNSYEGNLVAMLLDLKNQSFRFGTVCQFKQWTGSAFIPNPDVFGTIHHEGVFLEVVNADGVQQSFLQLDYGHAGTRYALGTNPFPQHLYGIKEYDWTPGCKYHCGAVKPTDGNPQRFVDLLTQYRSWHYNVFWYNCFSFAQVVFNYFNPQTPYSCELPLPGAVATKAVPR